MDEEVTALIKSACELVRNLEPKLATTGGSSEQVLRLIDEIVAKFNAAKGRLLAVSPPNQEMIQQQSPLMAASASSFLQQWLSAGQQFVQMPQLQAPAPPRTTMPAPPRATLQIMTDLDVSAEGDVEASPSSRRRKSRKDEAEKTTVMVAAVQFGNTDVPPEDGYTWRKYGQKEILGSNYPRSYFRCTHQKLYECPAKKQVQRLDSNPNVFAVTYRGSHTCHMSSTAPSSSVPPPPQQLIISQHDDIITHITATATSSSQLSPPSAVSVSGWLPSVVHPAGLLPGAGPSTSRFGADYPVADMADAMFNSGSSSGNNSMESLFASAADHEKFEAADNKKS